MAKYSIIILCILFLTLAIAGLAVSLIYGDLLFTLTFITLSVLGCRELHMETSRVNQFD
jgi:uncharacterized membrane protein